MVCTTKNKKMNMCNDVFKCSCGVCINDYTTVVNCSVVQRQ